MQTAIIDPFKYGFIPEELTGEEEILGATEEDEILQPNRDWTPYLGVKEVQNLFHETWNCTVFAMWNGLECYGKRKFEVEINGSDRFSGKMGGTNPGYGNTFRNSFATLNRDGFLYEEEYPFDSKDVYEYYKTIDERLKAKALERTKRFEFKRKLVSGGALSPEQLWEALQYTPLRVSVSAWNYPVNGVYTRVNTIINHAVLLFKGEYGKFWWIYDSYDDDIKKLSWDFLFGSADAITFNYKFMGNDFVRIVKDENSAAVGFFIPAISPDALKSMALAYGKEIPLTAEGGTDWAKAIEGKVTLNQPVSA